MFLLEKEKKAKSPHAGVTQPHTDERELAPPSSRLRSTRRVFVCFIRHVRDDTEFATEAHKLSYGTSYPVHVMSATRVHTEISGCSLDHRRVAGEGKHFGRCQEVQRARRERSRAAEVQRHALLKPDLQRSQQGEVE